MSMKKITDGVFKINGKIATKNLDQGKKVYGEKLVKKDKVEYRFWNPYKSKPSAAFQKGLQDFPVKKGKEVLYLGVGDGTTASHFSDIIRDTGIIIGVDIAQKAFENFLELCENRRNLIPVLADANEPEEYEEYIPSEGVDVVYQDIAQKEQTRILLKNVDKFLKKDGLFVFMVKSRSIDVTKDPKEIFDLQLDELRKNGCEIIEFKRLDPFEKDHAMIIGKKN
ncbi:MAG: fibrillarin-like rRNA/tRNA 2'-O-methyltransferase [archaeon]